MKAGGVISAISFVFSKINFEKVTKFSLDSNEFLWTKL